MRKRRIENQTKESKWFNPFSEESIKECFENQDNTSEARLSKILDKKKAAEVFAKETAAFARDYGLVTITVTSENSLPDFNDDVYFKYVNNIDEYESRLKAGDNAVAVFIKEENKVIAFGIANKQDHETEIEVIEVEINSTRSAGLFKEIEIENLPFKIGVGHLVMLKLLESCQAPIWTDATNDESRYICKSLGFVHDEGTANPCILRKDK